MTKKSNTPSQLPNAPLVEAVFELRWGLKKEPGQPLPLATDPGYPILAEEFGSDAPQHGFRVPRKMGPESLLFAYGIGIRFYKKEDQPFPIWQIGPGIFAANDSAAYEWLAFKRLVLDGTELLLSCYPTMKSFSFEPNYLELRYVDSFDSSIIGHSDLLGFLNEHTSFHLEVPQFLQKKPISKPPTGRLEFTYPVTDTRDTWFGVSIATGQFKNKDTIALISKVFTKSEKLNVGDSNASRLTFVEQWLEKSHAITSPFFKEFVSEPLMNHFKVKPNA
jgi:uncharacterized protein (TIGR04255 family)